MDLTVAIRTFDGAGRLPALFAHLRSQLVPADLRWEALVVDNDSVDATAEVVASERAAWPSTVPLRYFHEPLRGAWFARRRAIDEAAGEVVAFLDDDNWPDPSWVASAIAFGRSSPAAGAWGSRCRPVFEEPPPTGFDRLAPYFALSDRGPRAFCYNHRRGWRARRVLPPGAGLAVRRSAWLPAVPRELALAGPVGDDLSAKGEDIEALRHLVRAGWEVWHCPAMRIEHAMPTWRLQRPYLMRFCAGIGLSRSRLRTAGLPRGTRTLAALAYLPVDAARLALHRWRRRRDLPDDLVAACELQLLRSTLLGPLGIGRRRGALTGSPSRPTRTTGS